MHPRRDLPKLLGLTVNETVRFLQDHRAQESHVQRGREVWFTDEQVQALRELVAPWLQRRNTPLAVRRAADPSRVHGIVNVAKALGVKPHVAVELLREFDVPLKGGVPLEQIDDLKAIVELWLDERKREQQRAAVAERELRLLGRGLIKAVGERDRGRGTVRGDGAKEQLAEERRRQREQRKTRRCLLCGDNFLSWHNGNRLCARCGGVSDVEME